MLGEQQVAARLSAWDDCQVLGSLRGGYRNIVLLVDREGKKCVAKASRRSLEAIAWLGPVQEMARRAGFVVPHFLPSRSGELLVDGVTLGTWIEGSPPSAADLAPLGELIRRFHSLTNSWYQRPGFASTLELVNLERGGDVDLSLMPAGLVEVCRSVWLALEGEPVSAVHGDVNPANLLVTPEGRLALVDWDEARVDVSTLDAVAVARAIDGRAVLPEDRALKAFLAWEVAASWLVEPDYARRVLRDLLSGPAERNN